MPGRLALNPGLIATGLALDGCTKCGLICDVWMRPSRSCNSDHFRHDPARDLARDLGHACGTLDVAVGMMMRPAWRRSPRGDILPWKNARSVPMRVFRIAAAIALLTGPAYAHMSTPNINLLSDMPSKTPVEKEQEAAQQKAYKE